MELNDILNIIDCIDNTTDTFIPDTQLMAIPDSEYIQIKE